MFISRNTADKGAVSPRAFIDRLRDGNEHFHGVMYQDVREFLNYLLNEIVEEIQYDKYYKHKDKDKDNSSFQDVPQGCEFQVHQLIYDIVAG